MSEYRCFGGVGIDANEGCFECLIADDRGECPYFSGKDPKNNCEHWQPVKEREIICPKCRHVIFDMKIDCGIPYCGEDMSEVECEKCGHLFILRVHCEIKFSNEPIGKR